MARPGKRVDWKRWDVIVGTDDDGTIANIIGTTRQNVTCRRRKLGIRSQVEQLPPCAYPCLGKASDAEVAQKHGVKRSTVTRERVKRGIMAWYKHPPAHGTHAAYQAGCRCTSCKRANARRCQFSKYGLDVETVEALLRAQRHACAICRAPFKLDEARAYAVDHDHKTNDVRGLLCTGCNKGLGFFCDSPEIMQAAIAYVTVEKHRTAACIDAIKDARAARAQDHMHVKG